MRRSLVLLLLIILPWLVRSQALSNKLEFEHISIPGTTTSALADDIIQDSLGIIWISKQMLHRYDGKKFKSYGIIYPDSLPLSGKEITRLLWDAKRNRLLIGTRNHGLLQFRYEDDQISKLPGTSGLPIITHLAQTPDGKVWVSSFNSGLYTLENDTVVNRFTMGQLNSPSALGVRGDELWVGATSYLYILRNGKIYKTISLGDLLPELKGSPVRVSSLCITNEGIWVGTERNGVLRLNSATLKADIYFSPLQKPFFSAISHIKKDKNGLIWILTKNNGIALYHPKEKKYAHLFHDPTKSTSLSGDVCASMLVDHHGLIWIGSSGALNKYDRGKIKFALYKSEPDNPASLSDDNVRGLYESPDQLVWAATSDGRINILDRKNRRSEHIKIEIAGFQQFIAPLYFCPLDDRMLIGTSQGVVQFNPLTKKFYFFKPLENDTKGKYIRQLIRDGNRVYVQCHNALIIYELKENRIYQIGAKEGLLKLSCIIVDKEHHLWMGNRGGVTRYNPDDHTFQRIKILQKNFRPDSADFLVLSIAPMQNEIWVNTFNMGTFILEANDKGIFSVQKRLTTAEGLPDNTVYGSIDDNHNNIWMSTNNGLAFFERKKNKIVSFNIPDGLQDDEFNRLAFLRNPRGELFFGGINGINIFHPDSLDLTISDPKPQIIGLTATKNFSSPPFEKYFTFINAKETPELNYDERNLKFDFFVADYHKPSRYDVYYKLEPLEATWSKSENQNAAVYANLKPGDYTFSVKTINTENKELIANASFSILPSFWSTWWFYSISILATGLFIFVIVKSRIAATEAKQKKLEQLLSERTSEMERSNEELENLNRKKDLIFSILSHDLRSPLTTLKGFLGMIIENSESISKEELRKYSVSIRNSVTNSLDLIDNTLYWSLSQADNIQYSPTTIGMDALFQKVKGLYQLTAEKKQIKFIISVVEGVEVLADENMLYVLLRNLVSNAIKFTYEGKSIYLEASLNGNWVDIKVKDEGIGMTEIEISKIFTLDNPEVKRGTSSEKGTGLGLLLCKKFIEINGGKLKIQSKEGEGSTFTVSLPAHQYDQTISL